MTPRDIPLASNGEFLLAANQHGNSGVAFAIDGASSLKLVSELVVPKLVCTEVLDPT